MRRTVLLVLATLLMACALLPAAWGQSNEPYSETFGTGIPVGMETKDGKRVLEEAKPEPASPALPSLGNLLSHEVRGSEVTLLADGGRVRIVPRLPGVVRIDFLPEDADSSRHSWAVTRTDWPDSKVTVTEGDPLAIVGAGWRIDVERQPIRLTFSDESGKVLVRQSARHPMQSGGATRVLGFELGPDEAIYGMGNQDQEPAALKLDRRGHALRIDNRHPPMRLLFPFWISSRNVGVFIDNPGEATVDVGAAVGDRLEYSSEAGELSFYLFAGKSTLDVLDLYTQVTGRPALAPRWTLGNLQSRFGYNSFASLQSIIDGFRERRIPLDCVIMDLDWFGGDRMGNLEFQPTADWANPIESVAAIRNQGIKLIPITEPQVSAMSFNAHEAIAKGLVAREQDDKMPYAMRMWITSRAPIYLLDFTREETRQWWAEKHQKLIQVYAFDGFWQDLNEPEGFQDDMRFAGGSAAAVHNVIGHQMNRALAEAMEKYRPGARPFIMSRSGYAGMQKYGAGVWSGDVQARWFDLSRQPALALSMGLAGVPYWNSDVGGYAGESTPELYLRWCQFAFFNPIYRPHAAFKPREPWAFGAEVETAARQLLLLRYRLIPYFYGVSREAYDSGIPMMRPLFLNWPDDTALRDLDDQFLYGPSLMAAPVLTEGATSRAVYLPKGTWYDWFTGKRSNGPATIQQAAPLAEFPLFVFAPAIIPMGPEIMRSDERPLDSVTLRVYMPTDAERAEGHFYEDDGLTLDYQAGKFAITRFTANRPSPLELQVAISPAEGSFPGMVGSRAWQVEIHDSGRPASVGYQGKTLPEQAGTGGWQYDPARRVLTIAVGSIATSQRQVFAMAMAKE